MNAYHRSHSLLFQFLLHEMLSTLEEAYRVENFIEEKVSVEVFCHQMTEHLILLAGSELEYMRIFSWIVDSGHLTKVKNYARLLVEQRSEPLFLKLLERANQAWDDCLHLLELIRSYGPELKRLKEETKNVLSAIDKIFPIIEELLPEYRNDENVLLFLLKHKDLMDHTLGEGWTKKTFAALHPKGALPFLTQRYRERGFLELIPEISDRMKGLK